MTDPLTTSRVESAIGMIRLGHLNDAIELLRQILAHDICPDSGPGRAEGNRLDAGPEEGRISNMRHLMEEGADRD